MNTSLKKRLFSTLFLSLIFVSGIAAPAITVLAADSKSKKSVKKYQRKKVIKKKKRARKKTIVKKASTRKNQMARSVRRWLKKLRKRIARSEAKHNQLVAVGAVRGNQKPDAPPLYWKGKNVSGPVDLPELRKFDQAVLVAEEGNLDGAIAKLNAFISEHPKSPLVADAQKSIELFEQQKTP